MQTSGLMGGLFRVCEWITKFAYVNVLWVAFTLVGFIVFGFAPSTIALFSIVRKWILGESEFSILSTFWSIYKREFRKANLLWLLFMTVFTLMYIDWVLINSMQGTFYYFMLGCFIICAMLLTVVLIYIFPVYVHFEGSIFHYLKSALLLGASFPFRTFVMIISVVTCVFLGLLFPGVGILFLGSGISFALMYLSYSLFTSVTPKGE